MPSPYREAQESYLARYRETGVKRMIGIGREVPARRKDGSTFPVVLSVSELQFEHRRLFTGLIRDISDRKVLEKEVLEIAALEQRRIGQELHDSVGQELTGLGLLAGSLAEALDERSDPNHQLAIKLATGVKRIFGQIRSLSHGLFPPNVRAASLPKALAQLAVGINSHSNIHCTYQGANLPPWDDDFAATHLYRIAQEAVNNATKHASAKHIRISLEISGPRATLEVSDDGVGIQDRDTAGDGVGLRIMRYRADLIKAAFSIEPATGGGIVVRCTFMMDQNRVAAENDNYRVSHE